MKKSPGGLILFCGIIGVVAAAVLGIRSLRAPNGQPVHVVSEPQLASDRPVDITAPRIRQLVSEPLHSRRLFRLEQALQSLSTDSVERQPQIDKIVNGATGAERLEMLDRLWSEEAVGAPRELAIELLQKWSHEMPEAAAEWLARKEIGPLHQEAARSVAIIWANQNLNAAASWVRRWPDDEKDAGLLAVAYEAARSSPQDALWLASELTPTPGRDGLIAHAVRQWASQDADAPRIWAEKMEVSTLREEVFASTAISLSESDPAAAATLALQNLPPGGRQDDTIVSIVQRWAQTEPAQAADWVVQFPEGRLRDTAVQNLVQIWSEQANKPTEWLDSLEDGPVRDAGIATYARKLAPWSPEIALTWAAKISNPQSQAHEIEALAQHWFALDRKAAGAWIETAALPEELKKILLTPQ